MIFCLNLSFILFIVLKKRSISKDSKVFLLWGNLLLQKQNTMSSMIPYSLYRRNNFLFHLVYIFWVFNKTLSRWRQNIICWKIPEAVVPLSTFACLSVDVIQYIKEQYIYGLENKWIYKRWRIIQYLLMHILYKMLKLFETSCLRIWPCIWWKREPWQRTRKQSSKKIAISLAINISRFESLPKVNLSKLLTFSTYNSI